MGFSDIIAAHLGSVTDITTAVTAIRPVNAGPTDARPHIVYETIDMHSVRALNCNTGIYEGKVHIHVVADRHNVCNSITELVKDALENFGGSDATYKLTTCWLEDEQDVDQQLDEKEKPFYVKSTVWSVRGRKL